MLWTKEDILRATGGKLLREGGGAFRGEVTTDSKKVVKGSVFIALKGERFDGHDFLAQAVRRGATCLVVHRRPRVARLKRATVIQVRDTLTALGDMAHYCRKLIGPKVLALTGSNGKTTTKEMVAAILERATIGGERLRGKVLKTEGNFNNLVGVPLTLLRLKGGERAAVLELGTSRPGEIRRLTEIVDPDIGLITSVAPAHLSGLGSVAGVAREKGELFRRMDPGGVAVVNLDDPWVRRVARKFKGDKVTYGTGGEVRADAIRCLGWLGTEFALRVGGRRERVRLRFCGRHNVANAVAAAAMARALGADLRALRCGLQAVRPFAMRMALEKWRGTTVINDTYNANPASMEAALATLAEVGTSGRRIAVLGDMLELGRGSAKHHMELGRQAARYGIDRLYLLGREAGRVRAGALSAGMERACVTIARSHRHIARLLRRELRRGDWLLCKGSRGMRMEKVLEALRETGD